MRKFDELTEQQLSQLPVNIGQIMAARAGMVGLRLDAFIAPECLQLLLQFSTYIAALSVLGTEDDHAEIQKLCNECVDRVTAHSEQAAIASKQSIELSAGVCPVCDKPFLIDSWESKICPTCINGDAA